MYIMKIQHIQQMYNTNVYNKSTLSKIKVKCILWDTMYIIEYNVYNKSTMSIIKEQWL